MTRTYTTPTVVVSGNVVHETLGGPIVTKPDSQNGRLQGFGSIGFGL